MQVIKVIQHIVVWLTTYCDNAGLNGFVVGVSGGIDSAVTSALCAETGKEVRVLNMLIDQAAEQVALANRHIQWLEKRYDRVKGITVDLTPVFRSVESTFPESIQDALTMANTRARLRMLTLYAVASHHKLLVAGTGNKVEDFGVGFYTKYGDGGVDISPIADLMKSEVYAIGTQIGIDKTIINAIPTDGLYADNRSDESQIGATYAEMEWAMIHEDRIGDPEELSPRQKEVLSIYRKFRMANRHKMEPIPICRIPDDLKYKGFINKGKDICSSKND
jgi:NAD+ synthase